MAEFSRRFDDPFGDAVRLWERAFGMPWPQAVVNGAQQSAAGRFPVNIYEDGTNYYLTCMLPGVGTDNVEVTTEGNVLTISGMYQPQVPDGASPLVQEMGPMHFRRQFNLASGLDHESISAHYENGLLTLVIAKAAQSRTRRIPISSAQPHQQVTAGSASSNGNGRSKGA